MFNLHLLLTNVRDPTSSTSVATSHTVTPTPISSSRDIGATATSPAVTAVLMPNTEDSTNTKHGAPATPIKPIETVPHVIKSRQNRGGGNSTGDNFPRGGKKRSTGDGLSSSPSNFTPLHPRMAGGREGYSRDGGGVLLSRGDPSMFGSVSDGQHCVRIIDESLMWDDRGADVSKLLCVCTYYACMYVFMHLCMYLCICVCIYAFVYVFSCCVYMYVCLPVCLSLVHVARACILYL